MDHYLAVCDFVDHRDIGDPGPVTLALQEAYFNVVRGRDDEYDYWLERV